jgi:transketolase
LSGTPKTKGPGGIVAARVSTRAKGPFATRSCGPLRSMKFCGVETMSSPPLGILELEAKAKAVRRLILQTTHHAKMGHTGGSLSETDILTALFFHVMKNRDTKAPRHDRDRFILSKGHATPGYYSTLALAGYFPLDALGTFDALGSILQGHPDMHKTPGVDMSSGSLGQGLSCGIGIQLAAARTPAMGGARTFVLMGDGEVQEGQVWEAALYAGAKHVAGLVGIIDMNGVQLAANTADTVSLEPIVDKWRAFGWSVLDVDGHAMGALVDTLEKARELSAQGPVMVIARTVKGKGVSFMEGKHEWHGKAPNDKEFELAMQEIGA